MTHPLYAKADKLSHEVIGAAMEVHTIKGAGLLESIYERCMLRELEMRGIPARQQVNVPIEYKGITFDEDLRVDLLVDDCLIVELKCVESVHPVYKAQLLSYMKLLNVPVGLLINFHTEHLKDGLRRFVLKTASG
jgi:GxxExxY protein